MRAWTRAARTGGCVVNGFPAHAGMDPPPRGRQRKTTCRGFPAHAGMDRRRRLEDVSCTVCGFPAHAGMDPGGEPTRYVAPKTIGFPAHAGMDPCALTGPWWQPLGGFPAHAGMDPFHRACVCSNPLVGLPRACGDGPGVDATANIGDGKAASPRMRGWTRDDPDCIGGHVESRLPRACGDGPDQAAPHLRTVGSTASPRMRGWTCPSGAAKATTVGSGFPAHAGMDRHHAALASSRPGGGFPAHAGMDPTRRLPCELHSDRRGFPAHAGMDLVTAKGSADRSWLPRACGDGPVSAGRIPTSKWASPRMRGWTLSGLRHWPYLGSCGFPAHAGMDPCVRTSARHAEQVASPRMRGWTLVLLPRSECTARLASPRMRGWTRRARKACAGSPTCGFPAHAGMDPRAAARRSATSWLPRACGDGPVASEVNRNTLRASPRMRGWTHRGRAVRQKDRGFPAHAGMDPTEPSLVSQMISASPRMRGWTVRVLLLVRQLIVQLASPRMRGWTLRRCRASKYGYIRGFPAHAGMDPSSCKLGQVRATLRLPRACGDGPRSHAL